MGCVGGSAVLAGAYECSHSCAGLGLEADAELSHATVFVALHDLNEDIKVMCLTEGDEAQRCRCQPFEALG